MTTWSESMDGNPHKASGRHRGLPDLGPSFLAHGGQSGAVAEGAGSTLLSKGGWKRIV